ncbi:hypothetical protein HDU99_003202, partial [Rhizoclosmatium hyalinum]
PSEFADAAKSGPPTNVAPPTSLTNDAAGKAKVANIATSMPASIGLPSDLTQAAVVQAPVSVAPGKPAISKGGPLPKGTAPPKGSGLVLMTSITNVLTSKSKKFGSVINIQGYGATTASLNATAGAVKATSTTPAGIYVNFFVTPDTPSVWYVYKLSADQTNFTILINADKNILGSVAFKVSSATTVGRRQTADDDFTSVEISVAAAVSDGTDPADIVGTDTTTTLAGSTVSATTISGSIFASPNLTSLQATNSAVTNTSGNFVASTGTISTSLSYATTGSVATTSTASSSSGSSGSGSGSSSGSSGSSSGSGSSGDNSSGSNGNNIGGAVSPTTAAPKPTKDVFASTGLLGFAVPLVLLILSFVFLFN